MKILNKMVYQLGLEMNQSEDVEIKKIENEIQKMPVYVPQLLSIHQKLLQMTKDVYRLLRESQLMLNQAMASKNDQAVWEDAYSKAETADEAIQQLAHYKCQHSLIRINRGHLLIWGGFGGIEARFYVMYLKFIAQIVLPLLLLIWFDFNTFENIVHIGTAVHVVSHPFIYMARDSIVSYYQKWVALLLNTMISSSTLQSNIQRVLDAAEVAGIHVSGFIPGKKVDDSDSLICTLINSVNQEDALARIGCDDAPHEMRCPISHTIMTDPVSSAQTPHRFERTAILNWLKIRKIHPCTELPLTPYELKRDFKLQLDITRYVANKLLVKKIDKYPNGSPVVGLSMFQALTQSTENKEDLNNTANALNNSFGEIKCL